MALLCCTPEACPLAAYMPPPPAKPSLLHHFTEETKPILSVPQGFPSASVQAAVAIARQYRKGEVTKAEALLDIQGVLTSGEADPSNDDLTNAFTCYITIIDDVD